MLTPYPPPFLNGATLDVRPDTDIPDLIDLASRHHIDTVTVYGLEGWAPARRRTLIDTLADYRMGLIPRVEAYNPETFAFTPADATDVVRRHAALLGWIAHRSVRRHVPYISVNMPVDDGRVSDRLGGRGPRWAAAQVDYATAVTAAVRWVTGAVPVYLGLFYGWDNTYDLPSYAPAGADGYALTNYSYPGPDLGDVINAPRLAVAANRAAGRYPGMPMVVEYGFQTMNGRLAPPGQTAGLVADVAAKRRALALTTRFYRDLYPQVRGTMYFGLNVVKEEGDPPSPIDFTLL